MEKNASLLVKAGLAAGMLSLVFACAFGTSLAQAGALKKVPEGAVYSADGDCSACHENECSATTGLLTVGAHATLTCTTCHLNEQAVEDEASASEKDAGDAAAEEKEVQPTLDEVHAKVKEGSVVTARLKSTKASSEACLMCHTSWEALAEKTEGVTVLTDTNGTTVNPHAVTTLNDEHEVITCFSCHTVHSSKGVENDAVKYCSSCHHMNVYECYTCHE